MLPDEVRKAVERNWSNARVNAGLVRAMAQLDPRASNLNHIADDLIGLCDDIDTLRTHLLAREAEVGRQTKMLADCFRMAGADPDGNEDWRIAPDALRAVTDLRRDYDEVLDWQARSERAEATLREIRDSTHKSALMLRAMADRCITAHLSENSRG